MAAPSVMMRLVLLCVALTTQWRLAESTLCFKCDNVFQPALCMKAALCAADEACYIERGLSNIGAIQYYSGCMSQADCLSQNVDHFNVEQCMRCCLGDLCNIRGCGSLSIKDEDQLVCMSCKDVANPTSCTDTAICNMNEKCGVKSRLVNGSPAYDYRCFKDMECINSDVECCDSNGCNFNLTSSATPSVHITTPQPPTNMPDASTVRMTNPQQSTTATDALTTERSTRDMLGGPGFPTTTELSSTEVASTPSLNLGVGFTTVDTTPSTMMTESSTSGVLGGDFSTTEEVSSTMMSTTIDGGSTSTMETTEYSSSTSGDLGLGMSASTTEMSTPEMSTSGDVTTTGHKTPGNMLGEGFSSTETTVVSTTEDTTTVMADEPTTRVPIAPPVIRGNLNGTLSIVEKIGSDVSLTCDATGTGPISYRWVLPKNTISPTGPVLRLTDIQLRDAGEYICEASNSGGVDRKRFKLVVSELLPPETKIETASWVDGAANDNTFIIVECDATGNPRPQVTWSKYDVSTQPTYIAQEGILVFQALNASADSGLYVCSGRNNVSVDQSYMAIYQSVTVDCSSTFNQFAETLVYRSVCPQVCLSTKPAVGVSKNNTICDSLVADVTGKVAWSLRPSGEVLQLTTDNEGQIEVTSL